MQYIYLLRDVSVFAVLLNMKFFFGVNLFKRSIQRSIERRLHTVTVPVR